MIKIKDILVSLGPGRWVNLWNKSLTLSVTFLQMTEVKRIKAAESGYCCAGHLPFCHFNYCPLIWHYCGLGDLKKTEKGSPPLRFVFNDVHASYSDLSSRAGRPLLYIKRLKAVVTEVFRMHSIVSPAYNRSILIKPSTSYNVRLSAVWRYLPFKQ